MKDWHMHTNVSDGYDDVFNMLEKAIEIGLESISITDHDAIDAHLELRRIAGTQIDVFSGVELDCDFNGNAVEILAYGFNLHDSSLNDYLKDIQSQRAKRAKEYIKIINSHFGNLTINESEVFPEGRKTILKPHILRPLIEKGIFENYKAAKKFIANVPDVPIDRIKVENAVEIIHSAGGRAFLAHPGVYDFDRDYLLEIINVLKDIKIDGIEFYYPYFNMRDERYSRQEQIDGFYEFLLPLCNGLEISQGGDAHSASDLGELWKQRDRWAIL